MTTAIEQLAVALNTEGAAPDSIARLQAALDDDTICLVDLPDAEVLVLAPAGASVPALQGSVPALAVVENDARGYIRELLSAGASGVVALADVENSLVAALHAVARGLVVVPPVGRDAAVPPALSLREKQILGLVVMGLTNAEIGRRLFLAESTVKYHLFSLYGKLGVRTRREAAEVATDPRMGLSPGVLELTGRARRPSEAYRGPTVD